MNAYLSPWYRKVGVELTFCPQLPTKDIKEAERFEYTADQFCEMAKEAFKRKLKQRKVKVLRVDDDKGCIEIPTLPMKSWRGFRHTWDVVTTVLSWHEFYPQVKHFGTGGGHVNIDCPDSKLREAVEKDCSTRPYLNWCFNDPEDDDAGRWRIYGLGFNPYRYGFALSREGNRLEFRGFIAAKDWDEQEEHIAFVQKYVEWCNQRMQKGIVSQDAKTMPKFSYKESKEAFLKFIDELKLPVERYEHYTTTYLKERYRIRNLV